MNKEAEPAEGGTPGKMDRVALQHGGGTCTEGAERLAAAWQTEQSHQPVAHTVGSSDKSPATSCQSLPTHTNTRALAAAKRRMRCSSPTVLLRCTSATLCRSPASSGAACP